MKHVYAPVLNEKTRLIQGVECVPLNECEQRIAKIEAACGLPDPSEGCRKVLEICKEWRKE